MKIFKFGGASVKNADGVRNVGTILQQEGVENTLVVISAMGKMTNAFENIIDAYYYQKESLPKYLNFMTSFHEGIMNELFPKNHHIYTIVNELLGKLSNFMIHNTSKDYDFVYDQVVGFGELLSTKIVSTYLNDIGIQNNWIDVRNYIKTDTNYRDAKVDWELTEKNMQRAINTSKLNITQGFLGSNKNNTTSLGREGSDYTAGIFAYCLNAESVTIWKDVKGVLNGDPRIFNKTELLQQISYKEAIEMAFYGASVIHPKTIQPLERKQIPLFVRSFLTPTLKGTKVCKGLDIKPIVSCFIVKKYQILISISANDFSFMVEDNISYIFKKLHEYKLKVNLIQNSAISFSVCVDDPFRNFKKFYDELKQSFQIKYNENTNLYTIRHFSEQDIAAIESDKTILLKQINRETVQLVTI
ncbi:aspartate kinase [Tenacibaculum maritimum]|uniref:aspartate kinase n=1 Tax=Tenacibaculum maritimum TaxID=107401 RepID=UPI0012E6C1E1|nr:aspartate kinase [Tenacibaculum maritimum]MCD9562152.1 aspartate kinase [Tenacibaculum maritimum]MCD9565671.1 aspartate kinase [Tenacibaculum maritimum]MCD9578540.1 aspartate kinase [Tenacibaculum maritimum]MCD9596403.1 aspartate kinase [Tenacibaculum maritimum]MCD9609368.1 aspartate kinase [Tenacibaculum maritimum]